MSFIKHQKVPDGHKMFCLMLRLFTNVLLDTTIGIILKHSMSFQDIELLYVGINIETRVFRKPTNTDLYIHWQSLTPFQWKHSPLKILVYHSYIICSNEKHLHSELKYLRKFFHQNNGYPHLFINRVFDKVQDDFKRQQTADSLSNTAVLNDARKQTLLLHILGKIGAHL